MKRNDFTSAVVVGDLNTDLEKSSVHVNSVTTFFEHNNFENYLTKYDIDFTHTNSLNGVTFNRIIDHVYWCEKASENVIDAGVLHNIENSSDHDPIYCIIKLKDYCPGKIEDAGNNENITGVSKPSWKRASEKEKETYSKALKCKLDELEIPECIDSCKDVKCDNSDHRSDIDEYLENLFNMVTESASDSLPSTKNRYD